MEIPMCECKRCGHRWLIRVKDPKTCPKCKSPYWNKERQRAFKESAEGRGVVYEPKDDWSA